MTIYRPSASYLNGLIAPTFDSINDPNINLSIAIGYTSPQFSESSQKVFYYACSRGGATVLNQFGLGMPFNNRTKFELASISKTFTTTLYANLIGVGTGKKLSDYQGPSKPFDIAEQFQDILLDNLANYTSGFPSDNQVYNNTVLTPDGTDPPKPYSEAAMMSFLLYPTFTAGAQGTTYSYSNLAFSLMAEVIKTAAPTAALKHDFPGLMNQCIFQELGISPQFFDNVRMQQLILGYDCSQDNQGNISGSAASPGWPTFPGYFGAGGIVASPDDLMGWLTFNMGMTTSSTLTPLLLALQSQSTAATFNGSVLGMGWFIALDSAGNPQCIWKDGGISGTDTYITFLASSTGASQPDSQAGVFVLVNASGVYQSVGDEDVPIASWIGNQVLSYMQTGSAPTEQVAYPSTKKRRHR